MDREKPIGHYIFKRICVRSWWMIVFISLIIAFYFQAAHNRATASLDLTTRLHDMKNERMGILQEHEELSLRLQSEADPAWQELVLMKELGVVPEGFTKIQFQK